MEKFKNSHQLYQIQKCSHEHVTLPLGNFSPFFSPRVRWTQLPPRSIDGVAGRRQPLSGRVAVGGKDGAGWPVLGVEKPAAPSSAMSVWRETLKRSDACRCVLCVHTEQVVHTAITFDWNFVVSVSACTLDTDMFNDQCLRIWVKQRLSFVFFFYSLNGYILRRFGFQRQHTKKKPWNASSWTWPRRHWVSSRKMMEVACPVQHPAPCPSRVSKPLLRTAKRSTKTPISADRIPAMRWIVALVVQCRRRRPLHRRPTTAADSRPVIPATRTTVPKVSGGFATIAACGANRSAGRRTSGPSTQPPNAQSPTTPSSTPSDVKIWPKFATCWPTPLPLNPTPATSTT